MYCSYWYYKHACIHMHSSKHCVSTLPVVTQLPSGSSTVRIMDSLESTWRSGCYLSLFETILHCHLVVLEIILSCWFKCHCRIHSVIAYQIHVRWLVLSYSFDFIFFSIIYTVTVKSLDTPSHSLEWESVTGTVYINFNTNWSQSAGYIEWQLHLTALSFTHHKC